MKGVYDGLYTYSVKDLFDGKFRKCKMRCEILGETTKSYRIRLGDCSVKRLCGDEIWVRKKSIFRSYLNKLNGICDIYKLSPAVNSCEACLQNCFYKFIVVEKKGKDEES